MKRWILALLMACLAASSSWAQLPDRVTDRPPSTGPTQVKTGLYYIDISDIDAAAETFSATAYLVLEWNDPRLKFQPKDENSVKLYKPDEIWTPAVEVINAGKIEDQQPPLCTVAPDGTVFYYRRVVAMLNTQMDLRRFPFDRQQLQFIIETSSRYGSDDLVFITDPVQSGLAKDIVSRGWSYSPLSSKVVAQPFARTDQTYSRLIFSFEAKRNSGYYLTKIILPTAVFVLLTWSIFFMQVHDVQTSLIISITILLTAVAFGNVTDSLLPKVGYRTWLDIFQMGSFLFIVSTIVEAITVNGLHLDSKTERAVKLRRFLRVLYPVAYALFSAVMFLLAIA
jgi:hypothetical protein